MSGAGAFRRLLAVAGVMSALLGVTIASPLLVGRLLAGESNMGSSDFLVCLLLPTPADWPLHVVAYALAGVLLVGVLVGASSLLCQWYRTRRLMRALLRFRMPIDDGVIVDLLVPQDLLERVDIISIDRPVALCYGWLRPRICVATGALAGLSPSEIEALLLHERYQLLLRDPLKTLLSRVFVGLFFYLPVVRALNEQYLIGKEIEADRYVLATQRTHKPLLGALYKLLTRRPATATRPRAAVAVAGAVDSLNQRLDYLLSGRAPDRLSVPTLFTSAAIISALTIVTALVAWASLANALWEQAHAGFGGC